MLFISLDEVIAKTAEILFQVLLSIQLQYCVVKQRFLIWALLFFFRYFVCLLRDISSTDFKALAIAFVDGGRDELKIYLLLQTPIIVMSGGEY